MAPYRTQVGYKYTMGWLCIRYMACLSRFPLCFWFCFHLTCAYTIQIRNLELWNSSSYRMLLLHRIALFYRFYIILPSLSSGLRSLCEYRSKFEYWVIIYNFFGSFGRIHKKSMAWLCIDLRLLHLHSCFSNGCTYQAHRLGTPRNCIGILDLQSILLCCNFCSLRRWHITN